MTDDPSIIDTGCKFMFSRDSFIYSHHKTKDSTIPYSYTSQFRSFVSVDKVSTRCVCVTVVDRVNVPSHSQASIDAPTHTSYGIHRNDFVES